MADQALSLMATWEFRCARSLRMRRIGSRTLSIASDPWSIEIVRVFLESRLGQQSLRRLDCLFRDFKIDTDSNILRTNSVCQSFRSLKIEKRQTAQRRRYLGCGFGNRIAVIH